MAAAAAAVVVLPTPPEPQQITISLAASSGSSEPSWAPGRRGASAISTPAPRRGPRRSGGSPAAPWLRWNRSGTYRSGVPGGRPRAQRAEVLGPRAAQLDRQLGAVEQRRHRAADRLGRATRRGLRRRAARSKTSSSPRLNSSGSTRLTTTAGQVDDGLRPAAGRPARASR